MKTKRKELTEAVPRREMDPFDEMDRVFDTMFHRGWLRPFRGIWPHWGGFDEESLNFNTPRVDVIDRDEEVLVRAELPGVNKKDLKLDLTGQHLRIQGERRRENKTDEGDFVRSEIARGAFSRTVRLPEGLELDKVKADFTNGILEVHLPKTHKTERRQIKVD